MLKFLKRKFTSTPNSPEVITEEPVSSLSNDKVDESKSVAADPAAESWSADKEASMTYIPAQAEPIAVSKPIPPEVECRVEKGAPATCPPSDSESIAEITLPAVEAQPSTSVIETPPPQPTKLGFFDRLKQGLKKTRLSFVSGLQQLVFSRKTIDAELFQEIEDLLLLADVGVEVTQHVMAGLTARLSRQQLKDSTELLTALKQDLLQLLVPCEQPLQILKDKQPMVLLVVGINGVGKTTTIGKLAKRLQLEGYSVMLAAGDTFRAAAVEQLQIWGERNQIPVIAQQQGADSASVLFDAMQAAKARNIDVLIADTAGRLHTQNNLMEELKKVKRVMSKLDAGAPHEVLLVLDANTGQNAINQAQQFHQMIGVTGIALTKLDGTAKGGIIFALARKMAIPIRFIGIGEAIDDLRQFQAKEFVDALFGEGGSH
ncbi:hypothetical protein BH10PSE19_BH10PSE19_22240 [soil metagenome]